LAVPSGRLAGRLNSFTAFSLVEVVAAIGILAVALVAVLGLVMATVRTAGEVADADAVTRLNENIQGELDRLQADLGLAGLAGLVPPSGSGRPFRLIATRRGQRVRCADGAYPAADRGLDDQTLPGIANRDRYFLIEVSQLPGLDFAPGSGFLALSVRVTWPYQLPVGPPTPGATVWDADPAREAPGNERSVAIFALALRP
jgi:type II secretory pathway pseudopilin PulG